MKRIPFHFQIFLLFLLVLVACRPADRKLTSRTPSVIYAETGCPVSAPEKYQLIAPAQGICFLYPNTYNAVQSEDGSIMLYVRSMFNNHVPLAFINSAPAGGQTLEALAEQRRADYAWPDTQPESIMLGGETAVMLNNLPGQDTNRRVVVVHDDRVYDLAIYGIGANYGDAGELAEALYDTVIASFQFIDIDLGAPLLAGPECPFDGPNLWYTNEPFAYCMLLPADYDASMLDPEGAEMAFYVDSLQDKTHPRLFITVTDAGGRSLEEVTMDREAEIEKEVSGSDVMWSWGSLVDGESANEFRLVPGLELSRQVVTVHNGRVYTFTFLPDGPETSKAYEEMQSLYEMVMDSFSFLWPV